MEVALADWEVVVVLVRLAAGAELEVVARPPRLSPAAVLVVEVEVGAIPPRLSPGAELVVVAAPRPPRVSPVLLVLVDPMPGYSRHAKHFQGNN